MSVPTTPMRSVTFTMATTGFYGSTKVLVRHAAALIADGTRVGVAVDARLVRLAESAALLDELRSIGAEIHAIEGLTSWRAILPFGSVVRAAKEIDTDVLVSTQVRDAAASALLSKRLGVQFVALVQNHPRFSGSAITARVKWLVYRVALRAADRVVCVADHVASIVEHDLGVDPARIGIVANVAPVTPAGDAAADIRDSIGVGQDDFFVLNVARIHPQKGQLDLLDALAALGDCRVVVAVVGGTEARGAEEYLQQLRDRAEVLGVADQIRWLGFRNDVPALLGAADLFVSSSRWEAGPSLAVLEAMTAGCAVLATDHGDRISGFVDREHGLYVPARKPEQLADGLRWMIERSVAERAAMARAAQALAEQRHRRLEASPGFGEQLALVSKNRPRRRS